MPVIALVRFTPHIKRSRPEDKSYLDIVMPMFEGTPELKRKYFCATETGGMGVYEWEFEKAANNYYSEDWLSQIGTMARGVTVEILPIRGMVNHQDGKKTNFL